MSSNQLNENINLLPIKIDYINDGFEEQKHSPFSNSSINSSGYLSDNTTFFEDDSMLNIHDQNELLNEKFWDYQTNNDNFLNNIEFNEVVDESITDILSESTRHFNHDHDYDFF